VRRGKGGCQRKEPANDSQGGRGWVGWREKINRVPEPPREEEGGMPVTKRERSVGALSVRGKCEKPPRV